MTDQKITLEGLCEAWKHEHRDQVSGHLPTSMVFDLTQHSLSGDEFREAVQHLAACPACLQALKEMARIKARLLLVKKPLVAADAPALAPLVPLVPPPDRLLVGPERASAPSAIRSSLNS